MAERVPERGKVPHELKDLADQVGAFIHYWGFKTVHGRIWLHLYLTEQSLDARELIRRLDVSKALISISVAELLRYDVIREAGESEQGTQLYAANPDLYGVILRVLQEREKRMLGQVGSTLQRLKGLEASERTEWSISPRRLKSLGEFIDFGRASLDGLLKLDPIELDFVEKFAGSPSRK